MRKLVLVIGAIVALTFAELYSSSNAPAPGSGGTQQQATTPPDNGDVDGGAPFPNFP
jgi:hypothetical protein